MLRKLKHTLMLAFGITLIGGAAMAASQNAAQTAADVTCENGTVCRMNTSLLPLRVLTRPYSVIFKSKSDDPSNILTDNVKEFSPLYVFAREELDLSQPNDPKGWYHIGSSINTPLGWMRAGDVMEWRQALLVSYTHPGTGEEARRPVLMFKDRESLRELTQASDMADRAKALFSDLAAGIIPPGVISSEPAQFLNIDEKFYLLPVLDWESIDLFDDPARYLQLAAAVPKARAQDKTDSTLDNPGRRREFTQPLQDRISQSDAVHDLGIDVVFVMDLTNSMQPYVDSVRNALIDTVQAFRDKVGTEERIRFGLVGYRDSLDVEPRLEFVARNFTPELVAANRMVEILKSEAHAATMGSGDYAEEVYAGYKMGVESAWRPNTLRLILLIGDASGHDVGHPQNTTGLNPEELRIQANQAQVFVTAVYLKAQRAASDWPIALRQFGVLAANPGHGDPALVSVPAEDPAAVRTALSNSVEGLTTLIAAAQSGQTETILKVVEGASGTLTDAPNRIVPASVPAPATTTPASSQTSQSAEQIQGAIRQSVAGALVNYLGREEEPPRDITVWVLDRDLVDTRKAGLNVRVLVSRKELDDITRGLEFILDAVRTASLTQMRFFEALQALSAGAAQGQDLSIESTQRLGQSPLLPRWIESLPYRSDIAAMSPQSFEQLTADQRYALELRLDSKVQLYRSITEGAGKWIALNDTDATLQHVYPLPLEALP